MPKIPYSKKQIEQDIKNAEERLLKNGYTQEDLRILRNGLECLVYPLIKDLYRTIYEDL